MKRAKISRGIEKFSLSLSVPRSLKSSVPFQLHLFKLALVFIPGNIVILNDELSTTRQID